MVYFEDPVSFEEYAIYHTGPVDEFNSGEFRVVKIKKICIKPIPLGWPFQKTRVLWVFIDLKY